MDAPMGMDMGAGIPPMGADPMMGGGMPPMGDPGMGGMQQQNPFDTNFDAGVEADENSDPKKYIQQLTGKLSQSLRNYNDGQPQADADLNKYVAGMIIKQAIDGLSPDDVQEILKKVKSDEDMQQPKIDAQPPMEDPNNQPPMDQEMGGQQNQKMVNETVTLHYNDEKDDPKIEGIRNKKHGYRTKPFEYK